MIAMDLARNRESSHVVAAPMALMLIPSMVLLAILVGIIGFRAGAFDALNLIGLGFVAAVGTACVIYYQGAPWLVG